MGVRGLSTYILENSDKYLKPYELCNTYLVIDGNNVVYYLYNRLSQSQSAFGGDYDEYYKIVSNFFSLLAKCGVTPIVLFDGGYTKKKLKTVLSRYSTSVYVLKKFTEGFNPSKFFPIFLKQTFVDVLVDMNIFNVQCDFEADIEIATVARALNCPVLSNDSDFFIFDVLYIPLPTMEMKPAPYLDSKKYYVRCSIFHVTPLLNEFSGLDKSHLPIIATLLGNDYIESSLFLKFFDHVCMPKSKRLSSNQKRIIGLLHWLKKENVESATKLILSHMENKKAGKVLQVIKLSQQNYTSNFVSGAVLDNLRDQVEDMKLKEKHFHSKIPNKVMQLYTQSKINKLIIDVVSMGVYFTHIQIENVRYQSSHVPALPLIRSLYMLLIPYMEVPKPLSLYLTLKNKYGSIEVKTDPNSFLNYISLHEILEAPQEKRLELLCSIVNINVNDLNVGMPNYWSIFFMSFIYWIEQLKNHVSWAHVHALILMVIANVIVQKCVGKRSKRVGLDKLKNTKLIVEGSNAFKGMLESVTLNEILLIYNALLPYRKANKKALHKEYDISIIHLFACFQSCLFHIMQLNALLNYPLPHLKISDFYSGTLLFNFYVIIKNKPNFGTNLFEKTPNLSKIYTYLCESLCKFLNDFVVPKKSRKKKHKKISKTNLEEIVFCEDDDLCYVDESNPYAVLRNYTV